VILKAAWIVPVCGPPIRGGYVHVDGERIAAVGRGADLPSAAGPVVDLGDAILTPGLVNPHTHLELTGYAGRLEPGALWDWLEKLVRIRRAPGQIERETNGACEGAWQSLRAGVTCVGDITRRNITWKALKPIPIRKVCFVELLTIAAEPPRTMDELRAAVAVVEEDSLLTVGVSPHAPYTVPPEAYRAALAFAAELDRPWCTHWAETREEDAYVRGNAAGLPAFVARLLDKRGVVPPGRPPEDLLAECANGVRPGLLAHCNYVDAAAGARLAAAGHVVAYCPRAHDFFGHPPYPYGALREAGVPVAIGTDSAASNESLSLLDELHYVRMSTPTPPSDEVLFAAVTREAARALGLGDQIGTLEAGKLADLAAFPCEATTRDPLAHLISYTPPPQRVWVGGQDAI
jgi:5-methylthioadenosine/S-adenosylhomocysteine deaminase